MNENISSTVKYQGLKMNESINLMSQAILIDACNRPKEKLSKLRGYFDSFPHILYSTEFDSTVIFMAIYKILYKPHF